MRRVAATLAAAVLVLAGGAPSADAASQVVGTWLGTLDAGPAKLRLQFTIGERADGALTGTMVSLDQAAASVPVDAITVTGDRLHLEVKAARGTYDGTLNAEMNKVEGSWRQGVSALPLTLQKSRPEAVSQQPAQQAGGAEAVARKLVTCLAERKFQQATDGFDAKMKAVLPASKLQEAWDGLVAEVGAFQSVKSVRTQNVLIYGLCHVACQFEKKPVTIRVTVNRDETVGGLYFLPGEGGQNQPPPYAQPALFQEKQVVIGGGEWSLPGTLAMPVGKGPFPGVVLVHGSGPNDRDETVGANKPFRDLAWGLASQGIAVLRYEKRTKQYAKQLAGALSGMTVKEETVSDAAAAVGLLRRTEGVDRDRVFVLGHSLGGMLVPRIVAAEPGVAGCIVMAGAARPLEDLVLEQSRFQVSLPGELSPGAKAKIAEITSQVAAVKALSRDSASTTQVLGAPPSYWLDLRGYNPPAAAAALGKPMLILQGGKDCQVSAARDFPLWQKALGDRTDVEFKSYPDLNHLFAEVNGSSTGAEYEQPGNVAANVVSDVAAFVKKH